VSPAKRLNDRDAVWVEDLGGHREPCIRWRSRSPMERAILRGDGRPIVQYKGHSAVICAKTVEPTEMPFQLWARMYFRNHVLDGDPVVLRDVAMATNFSISVGYNVGCTIASDTLFDSRGGFPGSSYPMKTLPRSSV